MAKRRSDLPTHNEVEETVEDYDEQMSEKAEELEVLTEDTETVRDTHESLDLETTAEGVEEVEALVDEAEDDTVEMFDSEDENLEDIQSEAEDYENELDERHETGEADRDKISDASGRIETQQTTDDLANAEAAVLEEMDFLKDNNQKAVEAREENEQAQQDLRNLINSGRRS